MKILQDAGTCQIVEIKEDSKQPLTLNSSIVVELRDVSEDFINWFSKYAKGWGAFYLIIPAEESPTVFVNSGKDLKEEIVSIVIKKYLGDGPTPDIKMVKLSFIECLDVLGQIRQGFIEAGFERRDIERILPIHYKCGLKVEAKLHIWRKMIEWTTTPDKHWEIRNIMIRLLKDFQKLTHYLNDFEIAPDGKSAKLISP